MRVIDTGITKEMLTGDNHPQIKIGDKYYIVDDRKSTFDKIQKIREQGTDGEENQDVDYKILELALGEFATREIKEMDLPVGDFIHLTFCVMGAITGEDPKELEKMAKEKNL